jgi:hypothetical protein
MCAIQKRDNNKTTCSAEAVLTIRRVKFGRSMFTSLGAMFHWSKCLADHLDRSCPAHASTLSVDGCLTCRACVEGGLRRASSSGRAIHPKSHSSSAKNNNTCARAFVVVCSNGSQCVVAKCIAFRSTAKPKPSSHIS